MSCGNCTCSDCQEDREQDFYDEEEEPLSESPESQDYDYQNDPSYQGVAGPTAPAPTYKFNPVRVTQFGPRKSPPLTGEIGVLIEESFRSVMRDIVGDKAIPMPTLSQIILGRVAGIPVQDWSLRMEQTLDLLREKAQDPKSGYGIFRGRGGGFMRIAQDVAINPDVVTPSKAINDYVCPACGNTRCSRSERTCWKCGCTL